ncbi:biotin-dependent carboxyltransferase family protein [Erwiniaceae bacterium BAC15a-03b]|uniref:Biotin-dependent carboxyltransferase family protein n=1 Tax=Winslowiella arboricola TaxID=2978220 RepID=A0A9J6PJI5_9GAMM|nr:5-oxoprolinase subunit PxpC [Winslowiella arboricola]MCU5774173.1 biotin-dependent carboxyltransferase family protein [Winslowiella arboricola]MCU5776894.1 biotin-dependent carboxyltransferase family protein [Winslowiella arboricola]
MLTIIRAGMSTSIQDAGRFGWRQYGIGLSGALDIPAMKTANLLVGNPQESAVLEITLGQFSAEFGRDGWIALTGAGCHAEIDGKAVWTGWRTAVKAGQRLTLAMPQRGMRSYLALDGGFDLPPLLGSLSTDLKAGFGGQHGRRIEDGDQLPLLPATRRFTKPAGVRQLLWGNRVRALPGPEYHEFSRESQEAFWRSAWKLSPQSNRMGYRLHGRTLTRNSSRDMLSHGLLPGVVQVPPGGQPIVLMSDAQTTGGYPRIACVIEADLYHLAQVRLGEPLHFVHCTLDEALQAKQQQQRSIDQMVWGLENEN